ncbi:MAG: S8 family serine peptidase [Candidatus Hydrothermales bacterium]
MKLLFLFLGISKLTVNFHTVSFDPLKDKIPLVFPELEGSYKKGINYILIQFREIPLPQEREIFSFSYGIEFTPWYIHENTFIVKINSPEPEKKVKELSLLENVRWVSLYKPLYKFTFEAFDLYLREKDVKHRFYVHVFDVSYLDELVLISEKLGAEIEYVDHRKTEEERHLCSFGLKIEPFKLSEIANHPGVYVIGRNYDKMTFNDASRWVIQTNVSVDTSIWRRGIHGENVIIGHNDDGLDPNHCFFNGTVLGQNKIVYLFDYNGGGFANGAHGTHTAGSACGGTDQQSSNLQYRGMAYKARLISQEPIGAVPPGFYSILMDAYNLGARVHTNSWGYQCFALLNYCGAGGYEGEAIDIDNFVWNYNDMTVLFAAANGGDCVSPFTCGNGRRMSRPATAKNDITVVATRRAPNQEYKANWSSYGAPSNLGDNRLGTDITAPGENVYSADNETACAVLTMSGTSMATPTAAGAAALVIQYFKEGFYGNGTRNSAPSHNPSSALVRAVLLASARDMQYDVDNNEGGPANSGVPNIYEGAGRITLEDALWFGETRKLLFVDGDLPAGDNQLTTGDSISYRVNVLGSDFPLIIVLSWIDYFGSANTYPVIVNDLDLKVISPTGTIYRGNYTSGGWSIPGGSFDRLNLWELFKLQNPAIGEWRIVIRAYRITQPKPAGTKYPFALVVTGNIGQIQKLSSVESFFALSSTSEGVLITFHYGGLVDRLLIYKKDESDFKIISENSFVRTPFKYVDKDVKEGKEYEYKVLALTSEGVFHYGPLKIKYDFKFNSFELSTNITGSKLKILFTTFYKDEIEINLYDIGGKRVQRLMNKFPFDRGLYSIEFELGGYGIKPGIYFLELKGRKINKREKVILF